MEMARFKTLVPSPTPVPTPPTAPPKLPLAAVVPSEGVRSNPVQQTMSRAWADQNKSLARNASCNFDEVRIRIPGWLSLFGFQTSKCKCAMAMPLYTAAIFCFIGAAVAMQLVHLRDPGSMEGRFGNEVILVMGLCSAACLLQLNFRRPGQQSAVQVTSEMFTNNKMLPEYVDLWLERCRRSGREVLCLWFLSVATETAALLLKSDNLNPGTTAVHLVVFATVATWFSALSLYLLLVCCAQAAMVDHYSVTAAEQSRDYEVLRHRWDQIQAILRHSAQCLTPCLLILTLTPVIVVVTSIIELIMENEYDSQTILLELFPKAFWLLGIIRVLSKIGEVTGKCDRLPVFLNSLLLGDGFDEEGFRLLDFIERSKAGFYAFDAKVDYSVTWFCFRCFLYYYCCWFGCYLLLFVHFLFYFIP
ncbi:unnamed protein product [Polarella glacialis]|uniref:Gustatory receptor n=1 Tax=Polarella glacialis TaxID=89957 RepID=A0A813JUR9_POLGL|nr:unnamed protein product [Polarella glacialis]